MGQGKISIWQYKWLSAVVPFPMGCPIPWECSVKELFGNVLWLQYFKSIVSNEDNVTLDLMTLRDDGVDSLVYSAAYDGRFTAAQFLDSIRFQGGEGIGKRLHHHCLSNYRSLASLISPPNSVGVYFEG